MEAVHVSTSFQPLFVIFVPKSVYIKTYFNRVLKQIQDSVSFALPYFVIGPESSRQILNQSDAIALIRASFLKGLKGQFEKGNDNNNNNNNNKTES